MRHAKVLLIIGNGFDLECKLKSKYEDYFNDRLVNSDIYRDIHGKIDDDMNLVLNKNSDIIKENKFSLFDLMMINNDIKNVDWNRFEKFLHDLLFVKDYGYSKKLTYFENLSHVYFNLKNKSLKRFDYTQDAYGYSNFIYLIYDLLKFRKYSILTHEDFINVVLKELIIFENNFANYLKNELIKHSLYNQNASDLFDKLVELDYRHLTNIMSFNYTYFNRVDKKYFENVHGRYYNLDNIFGIDISNIKHPDSAYIFTKTYRKVNYLITKPPKIKVNFIEDTIEKIIFYGHSLNEQDYSYFQSIFDYYDIYHSKMILIFKYKIFDNEKKDAIEIDLTKAVTKLFEIYGSTFDNEKIGKNILHKLINEKRVLIERIY